MPQPGALVRAAGRGDAQVHRKLDVRHRLRCAALPPLVPADGGSFRRRDTERVQDQGCSLHLALALPQQDVEEFVGVIRSGRQRVMAVGRSRGQPGEPARTAIAKSTSAISALCRKAGVFLPRTAADGSLKVNETEKSFGSSS